MSVDEQAGDQQAQNVRPSGGFDPNIGFATRFQPGQSGNPAGRAKGSKSLSQHIRAMLNDPKFVDKLSETVKGQLPDADFQDIPAKAIITTALIEAMDPSRPAADRQKARDWLARYGYGTKIDITSDDERIAVAPLVISAIKPREDDDDDGSAPPVGQAS